MLLDSRRFWYLWPNVTNNHLVLHPDHVNSVRLLATTYIHVKKFSVGIVLLEPCLSRALPLLDLYLHVLHPYHPLVPPSLISSTKVRLCESSTCCSLGMASSASMGHLSSSAHIYISCVPVGKCRRHCHCLSMISACWSGCKGALPLCCYWLFKALQ